MKRIGLIIALATAFALALAPAALASHVTSYQANLSPLNGSGSSGTATVEVQGDQVTVTTEGNGLVPGKPHPQHIHIGNQNVCPPASADTDGDGIVSVAEGQPFYGPIEVSLTTSGDVSTESGMAVDRFPVADSNGNVSYSRTFTLPDDVSPSDIANGVVVQHGINADGQYQGTIPADCGKLQPAAMPDTGGPSPAVLGLLGGAALISLGGAGFVALRRNN